MNKDFLHKEFVPYEQALELKQLGFDEPCLATHGYLELFIGTNDGHLKAPLYQQAFRWFREKYGLCYFPDIGSFDFSFRIFDLKKDRNLMENILHPIGFNFEGTYEEAELACLKKLIEIIKK